MTHVNLEELESLEKQATAGPWSGIKPKKDADGWSKGCGVASTGIGNTIYANPPGGSYPSDDQKLIIAMRNALPSIIHELKTLREACERYEGMDTRDIIPQKPPTIDTDVLDRHRASINGIIAADNEWRLQRDTISAWVKEQMGEVK